MRAMLALAKYDDAFKMAKSYYNLVDIKGTATAVDFVGTASPRPGPTISKSSAVPQRASPGQPGHAARRSDKAILKTITIDDAPFADALKTYSAKTKFADRVGYANLLLLSDHGTDAEKVFRELYQVAATADELTQATEGIARSFAPRTVTSPAPTHG